MCTSQPDAGDAVGRLKSTGIHPAPTSASLFFPSSFRVSCTSGLSFYDLEVSRSRLFDIRRDGSASLRSSEKRSGSKEK